MKIKILVIFAALFLLSFKVVGAQVTNTDAPNTAAIVQNCLDGGGSPQACAEAGAAYLRGLGFTASADCSSGTACIVTCSNGGSVSVPLPPSPPPVVNCPGATHKCGAASAGGTICNGKPSPGDLTGTDNTSCGKSMYCWYCPPPVPTSPPPVPTTTPTSPPPIITPPPPTPYPPTPTVPSPPVTPTVPPPTATPTTPPACNAPCTSSTYCVNANDGCTVCLDKPGGGGKTCQKPPTPTPTTVPACNAPCTSNSYCQNAQDGCTVCNDKPGGGGKTCQTPPTPTATPTATPTPTPPFDEAMCKCDGIDFTSIALGMTTNITAYGKVMGTDTNYAKIPSMTFTFFKGKGVVVDQVKKQTINTTIVEQTAQKVRYQAVWPLNLPTSLDTSLTYRIQAKLDCSRKSAMFNAFPTTVVLAANDTKAPSSFWGRITSFFAGIFGGNKAADTKTAAAPANATPTLTQQQKKQLQLKTFTPATGIATDNCTFVKFNF